MTFEGFHRNPPGGFVGNPCKPSKMPLLLGEGVDQSYIVEDCAIDVDSIVVSGSL